MVRSVRAKHALQGRGTLPGWFPLPIYYANLTPDEWLHALLMRKSIKADLEEHGNLDIAREDFDAFVVKNLVCVATGVHRMAEFDDPSVYVGIRDLSAFDAAYISSMLQRSKHGKRLIAAVNAAISYKEWDEASILRSHRFRQPKRQSFMEIIDYSREPYAMGDMLSGMPLVADLTHDDESLFVDFKVWLSNTRKALGAARKPLDQKDFRAWRDYGVLPVFDLSLWAELHNVRLTDSQIATAIWPYAEIDTTERLRKVTRPKIREIFDSWTFLRRFWRQLAEANGGMPPPPVRRRASRE